VGKPAAPHDADRVAALVFSAVFLAACVIALLLVLF